MPTSYNMIPALYPKLAFDPVKSFAPVVLFATGTLALVEQGLPQFEVGSWYVTIYGKLNRLWTRKKSAILNSGMPNLGEIYD